MEKQNFDHLSKENIVAFLADVVERRGGESYLGEQVTMAAHMLQCAHYAAESGGSDELITAALLHDVGHYLSEFAPDAANEGIDNNHESAGAVVLEPYFPGLVTDCVKYHVAAKRYLCATNPEYCNDLSDASILSLELQGGPMSAAEVAEFEQLRNLEQIVQVRLWDDLAKDPNKSVPGFAHYRPILERVVRSSG